MLREFKDFAVRGNVIDLAVGFILGAAFTTIVKSIVDDIIMPPIGLLLGGDFTNLFIVLEEGTPAGPYVALAAAKEAGAITINYGVFINAVITFLIVALVLFLLIRWINRLKRQQEAAPPPPPNSKECPYCLSPVPIRATRCPACTSALEATPAGA
jgi:large conductance mechanosensitive channel